MGAIIKKELLLEGLNCAHCAAKIEEEVKNIEYVCSSTVNFLNKTLTVETGHTEKIDEVIHRACEIVSRLEPDVIVKEKESLPAKRTEIQKNPEFGGENQLLAEVSGMRFNLYPSRTEVHTHNTALG